jgi:CBS domain-containing protein
MKLSELLVDAWAVVPLEVDGLGDALEAVLRKASDEGALGGARARNLARDLAGGSRGEILRVADQVIAVIATLEALERPALTVGVAPEPFTVGVPAEDAAGVAEGEGDTARVVLLILVHGKLTSARQDIVPAIARVLRDPGNLERLLAARTVDELRALRELMDTEVHPRLLVEDALVTVRYRVYPDTPVSEVVDLMVRRGVHAVPVVGERYEVLGILTSGDALAHMLSAARRGEDQGDGEKVVPTARDFMTRSVLCVSEDQALSEAANMMVNRDVEQLPVVREGELVGFVTRESILRALHEGPSNDKEESESST